MFRKNKKIIIASISLFCIILIPIFLSMDKFSVYNPISALYGLSSIRYTDTEYVEIQNTPKVIMQKLAVLF